MTPYLWHAIAALLALGLFEFGHFMGTRQERHRCWYAAWSRLARMTYEPATQDVLSAIKDGVPLAELQRRDGR